MTDAGRKFRPGDVVRLRELSPFWHELKNRDLTVVEVEREPPKLRRSGMVRLSIARAIWLSWLGSRAVGATTYADHDASLAAAPGHRRHPRQGAQGVVISSPQRLSVRP